MVVTPGTPKVTAVDGVVAAIPPAAAAESGSAELTLPAFTTAVFVYRDSSTLFRAVCRFASRLLAVA